MILTVTLNPLLEKRLYFNSIKYNQANRSNKEEFRSGGKGINVSRQLNALKMQNQAITFLGGQSGKILRSIYHEEQLNYLAVSTKAATREAVLTIDEKENNLTTYFPPNPIISESEAADFASKLDKMIANCSIVVFSGSSPCKETDFIFPYGIELANKYDKISILDTYGNHLQNCIDKAPTVLHNNVEEINLSLKQKINDGKDKIEFLNYLYNKGIKLAFLTDGEKEFYCSKFNFHYKINPQNIKAVDSTGSGDAFVAGIAYGMEKDLVFNEFTQIASALGIINAQSWKTCNFPFEDIESLSKEIVVEPVGKKMKIIDDSPTI